MEEDSSDVLAPPEEGLRHMTRLDRSKFAKTVQIPWVSVAEENAGAVIPILKKYLLQMENMQPIRSLPTSLIDEGQSTTKKFVKKVLLNPNMVSTYEDFPIGDQAALKALGIGKESFHLGMMDLRYENWKGEEILKAVLPHDFEHFSGYSKVGHLVYLNLPEHLRPYGQLIGQVLLDKVKGCFTVVNKEDNIDSTYSKFLVEVLAGEPDMLVEVKENYCRYHMDFTLVYWNPHLSLERQRIISKLDPKDVVYDVFAGVGPFAIPAARKKCSVLANDLNVHTYRWLWQNVDINNVKLQVQCFNKDGREFIWRDVAADMMRRWSATPDAALHVIMDHPECAIDFLDAFFGACGKRREGKVVAPIVHLYAFTVTKNPAWDVCDRVELALGVSLGNNLLEVVRVQDGSPRKMMRVSFVFPENLLFTKKSKEEKAPEEESERKKIQLG